MDNKNIKHHWDVSESRIACQAQEEYYLPKKEENGGVGMLSKNTLRVGRRESKRTVTTPWIRGINREENSLYTLPTSINIIGETTPWNTITIKNPLYEAKVEEIRERYEGYY